MKYIILTYESPQDFEARNIDDFGQGRYWTAWQAYIDLLFQSGIVESMHSLLPDYTATTLRLRDGKCQLHDGPYADTREQVGGFFIIDVGNLDQALDWAEKCPAASSGAVEVRPLMRDCADCQSSRQDQPDF